MKQAIIRRFKFSTHLKYNCISFFSLGIFFGIIACVASFFGGDVTVELGDTTHLGTIAGIMSLFIWPILMLIIGLVFGLLSYLPVMLLLKIKRHIVIYYVDTQEESNNDEQMQW